MGIQSTFQRFRASLIIAGLCRLRAHIRILVAVVCTAVCPATPCAAAESGVVLDYTVDECIRLAMENNHRRPASAFAVAAAEALHRQALSGYWPQLHVKAAYEQLDEMPNFLFPATALNVPSQTATVPGGNMDVTVGGRSVPVTYPPQSASTPEQDFPVPEQDIQLADPESFIASASALWLLYDGGMRRGYREQAQAAMEAARQAARRTDLEIVDSVRRYFYGAVLARQLHQLGKDTLARMEATLSLTESLYKEGSGKVTKTDFLDNKVMVETLRAMISHLEKNEELAKSALAYTMGLSWRDTVVPKDKEVPFTPLKADIEHLVATAYEFSPDWARLHAGIDAYNGEARTARSGHHPKVALTGELHKWWNEYDAGIATEENKDGWIVGVGMEIPLFEGFLVNNKVKAAEAKANELKELRFVLREGIGLQVKDLFLGLKAAGASHQATHDAMTAAIENRELNTRAYQNELAETEDVVRSQLVEALMCAQYYKTTYDYAALLSQMNLVVGTEVLAQLEAP